MSDPVFDVNKFLVKDTKNTAVDEAAKRRKDVEKNKDAFLQMMVAQLKNQDPMSPVENQDFLAQMAQFTTVEEIQKLASASTANSDVMAVGLTNITETLEKMNSQTAQFQKSIKESLDSIQEILKKDD